MKFIQTIRFSTSRIDEIQRLAQEFDSEQAGTSTGLISAKTVRDRARDNAYMIIAEFESAELAMQNSARPETDAFAKKLSELVDGELGFDDYDVIDEMGSGTS